MRYAKDILQINKVNRVQFFQIKCKDNAVHNTEITILYKYRMVLCQQSVGKFEFYRLNN